MTNSRPRYGKREGEVKRKDGRKMKRRGFKRTFQRLEISPHFLGICPKPLWMFEPGVLVRIASPWQSYLGLRFDLKNIGFRSI